VRGLFSYPENGGAIFLDTLRDLVILDKVWIGNWIY
jgi:hypothetical protein